MAEVFRPAPRSVLGLDTDVLVHWAMADAPHHRASRQLLATEIGRGHLIGLTLQTMREFLHVVTDPKRFERPLEMEQALALSLELW